MIKVGLLGYGYWGPNLLRNLIQNEGYSVSWVLEPEISKSNVLQNQGIRHIADTKLSEQDYSEVDALIIATPPPFHYQQVKDSLLNNKHVLVSKPVVTNYEELEELLLISKKNNLIFETDLTYLFSSKVEKLKEIYESNELGKLIYIDSQRINLGIFQEHTNVVWDLLPHDLSIFTYIFGKSPENIKLREIFAFELENSSSSYVEMSIQNVPINIHISWASPVKVRKMLFVFEKALVIYDDLNNYEPIKIYKFNTEGSSQDKKAILTSNVIGDVEIPNVDNTEPLSLLVESFKDSIVNGLIKKNSVKNIKENIRLIEEALK